MTPIIRIEFIDHASKKIRRIDHAVPSISRAFEVIDRCDDPSMKHPMQALADRVVMQDREHIRVNILNNLRTLLEENDTRNGYTKQQLQDMLEDLDRGGK